MTCASKIGFFKEGPANVPAVGKTRRRRPVRRDCLRPKLSHWLVREKLLSDAHRKNIEIIKERLEKRAVLTVSVFLFYALSPLPSNFLFIAYGLTGLPLLRIALPFFIGRTATYSFFILSGAGAGRRFHVDLIESAFYASVLFIGSQVALLGGVYDLRKSIGRLCLMSTGSCGYPNQARQPMSAINAKGTLSRKLWES